MKPSWPRRPTGHALPLVLLVLAGLPPRAPLAQQATTVGGEPSGGSTPSKTQKVTNLTARYRFSERSTTQDEQVGPGVVGPYRVGIVEVIKDSLDSPQGAPKRTEATRQAIFTERPAEMGSLGSVASVTRTFERFRTRPEDPSKTMGGRPLEGLSALIRPKTVGLPLVIGLDESRSLTEYEYDVAARQVFVPQLAALLPTRVVRVGDTWSIASRSVESLLGGPGGQGDNLTGKLNEIRKEVDGPRMVASIAITGKVKGQAGDTTINAEALFTFVPESPSKPPSARPPSPRGPAEESTEARGAITELRLARQTSGPLPGPGRLRFQSNRELTLHRQLGTVPGAPAPPKLEKLPEPTEANTWLTHVDASGRYAFRHPQDLLLPDRSQPSAEPNTSLLVRTRHDGPDLLQVEFAPKVLTPDDLKKDLADKYGALNKPGGYKLEVSKGEEKWLPEADWPRMRVHRVEAEVQMPDSSRGGPRPGPARLHFDGYLILFGQSASILAVSTTSRDAVGAYRQEVEKILKTIQLDPPRPAVD